MRTLFILMLLASPLNAQLMLTAEHVPATTVVRINRGQYKHTSVIAERLPDLVEIDLLSGSKPDEFVFPPEAPRGKYRVVANAFDAELGIGRKTLIVELGDRPEPVDPTDPTGPDTPDEALSALSKESRAAIRKLVSEMADTFDEMAKRAKDGKYQSVMEAASDSVLLDLKARERFKAAMANAMRARLGDSALPVDAPMVFTEMAIGFRGVK